MVPQYFLASDGFENERQTDHPIRGQEIAQTEKRGREHHWEGATSGKNPWGPNQVSLGKVGYKQPENARGAAVNFLKSPTGSSGGKVTEAPSRRTEWRKTRKGSGGEVKPKTRAAREDDDSTNRRSQPGGRKKQTKRLRKKRE